MGPPKQSVKKRRAKRDLPDYPTPPMYNEYHSMPSTPNLGNLEGRHRSTGDSEDSDTAYGFDTKWGGM